MRAALILLAILIPTAVGAREGDLITHTTAEYLAAHAKARTYALGHLGQERQPSCRRAIGTRPAQILQQQCLDVSASTRTACGPADRCEGLLDGLDAHCLSWRGDVACVYDQDGGAAVMDWTRRGSWKPKEP